MNTRLLRAIWFLSIFIAAVPALAQSTREDDRGTPPAQAKGSHPLGSYSGGTFDSINLFNGNLTLTFPLATLDGRAGMGASVLLSYNSKFWRVEKIGSGANASYYPLWNEWDGGPRLAPGWRIHSGLMRGRQFGWEEYSGSGGCTNWRWTLTRLTFIAPDGTEYSFVDDQTGENDGAPHDNGTLPCNAQGFPRGTRFRTTDGTAATYVNDTEIRDRIGVTTGGGIIPVNTLDGWVYLRNGMRFRIENGLVTSQVDRNGNTVRYDYDTNQRLIKITDTLGREITITYSTPAEVNNTFATIQVKGTGGFVRSTYIRKATLGTLQRDGGGAGNLASLFPRLDGSSAQTFNPDVVSSLDLPGGYQWIFRYNQHGEVTQIQTPAKGEIEYDFAHTSAAMPSSTPTYGEIIFRYATERRTFPATTGNYDGKTTYTDPTLNYDTGTQRTMVRETRWDHTQTDQNGFAVDRKVTRLEHYFQGSAVDYYKGYPNSPITNTGDSPWLEGREVEIFQDGFIYDAGGNETVVARTKSVTEWEQRAALAWAAGDANKQPGNDTRVKSVTTTIRETTPNKISKVSYLYDSYNNVTQEKTTEFYEQGASSIPTIRQVDRTFESASSYVGVPSDPFEANRSAHLRSLLKTETVSKGGAAETTTIYEYDNYSTGGSDFFHDPLLSRTLTGNGAATHNTAAYGTNFERRGNVTSVTVGLGTDASTSYMKYDILGNVIATISPRVAELSTINATTVDPYTTNITFGSLYHFAYPTSTSGKVTPADGSALQQLVTESAYNFDTGAISSFEGFNGEITSYEYDDSLDRITRIIRPSGLGETVYTYSAGTASVLTVTEQTLLTSGVYITSKATYDGLFRVKQTETSEPNGTTGLTKVETRYDGLGRAIFTSNPNVTSASTTDGWARTTYDDLGRVTEIATFSGKTLPPRSGDTPSIGTVFTGKVTSVYSGPVVTATDQAGRDRKSTSDSLGRIVEVIEDPGVGGANYKTTYEYDVRGNLLKVKQRPDSSPQIKEFQYDSLGRMTLAKMPECGPSGGIGSSTFSYDKASNLKQVVTPRAGYSITYSYDEMNRVRSRNYSNTTVTPDVSYFYDASNPSSSEAPGAAMPPGFNRGSSLGKLAGIITNDASAQTAQERTGVFYGYDIGGRLVRKTQLVGGTHYASAMTYNQASLPVTQTYPSSQTQGATQQMTWTYNNSGLMTGATRTIVGGSVVTVASNASYTPAGGIKQQQLGNGLYHTQSYNSRLQPLTIGLGTAVSGVAQYSLLKLEYDYGKWDGTTVTPSGSVDTGTQNNGNPGRIRIVPGVDASNNPKPPIDQYFKYDDLNRLTLAKEYYDAGQQPGGEGTDSIGTYVPSSGAWFMRNSNSSGPADYDFFFGPAGQNWKAFTGDWDGNGTDTPGLYAPNSGVFMEDTNGTGEADNVFFFGSGGSMIPIAGNWDGLGGDSIGLYDPSNGSFFLRNSNTSGPADISFFFGPVGSEWLPVAGDWDGNGTDTIGVFNSTNGQVYLRNSNSNGGADHAFVFGGGGKPVAGDWNNDGIDTIGFYVPLTGAWFLKNSHAGGNADLTFFFGQTNVTPLAGDWDGGTALRPEATDVISWTRSFSYDQFGNRTDSLSPTIDPAKNQYQRAQNGYQYDDAGNLTQEPVGTSQVRTFAYDAENRMHQATLGSEISKCVYDGEGKRVKRIVDGVTTVFAYGVSGSLLAEYTGSPLALDKEYLYGLTGLTAVVDFTPDGIVTKYLPPDHLGSPRIVTDNTGEVLGRHDYFPYGERLPSSYGGRRDIVGYGGIDGVRQGFTGYEKDEETGLDFAQARYYASAGGRFTSIDPLLASGSMSDPQSWNRYTYGLNNPIKMVDPSGMISLDGPLEGMDDSDLNQRGGIQQHGGSYADLDSATRSFGQGVYRWWFALTHRGYSASFSINEHLTLGGTTDFVTVKSQNAPGGTLLLDQDQLDTTENVIADIVNLARHDAIGVPLALAIAAEETYFGATRVYDKNNIDPNTNQPYETKRADNNPMQLSEGRAKPNARVENILGAFEVYAGMIKAARGDERTAVENYNGTRGKVGYAANVLRFRNQIQWYMDNTAR